MRKNLRNDVRLRDAHRLRDRLCSHSVVSGYHPRTDAATLEAREDLLRFGPDRIGNSEGRDDCVRFASIRAGSEEDDALSFAFPRMEELREPDRKSVV